jgi:exodeoxyribonuclease V gamma subunit
VVQGRGMERWISQRLAAHFGIWANPYFLFARKILRRSIEAVLGEPEERSEPFEPAALTWTVAPLLPDLTRKPGFEQIASYLADDQTKTLAIHLSPLSGSLLPSTPGSILASVEAPEGARV